MRSARRACLEGRPGRERSVRQSRLSPLRLPCRLEPGQSRSCSRSACPSAGRTAGWPGRHIRRRSRRGTRGFPRRFAPAWLPLDTMGSVVGHAAGPCSRRTTVHPRRRGTPPSSLDRSGFGPRTPCASSPWAAPGAETLCARIRVPSRPPTCANRGKRVRRRRTSQASRPALVRLTWPAPGRRGRPDVKRPGNRTG